MICELVFSALSNIFVLNVFQQLKNCQKKKKKKKLESSVNIIA